LVAVKFGQAIKYGKSLGVIDTVASAIFPFDRRDFPNERITSWRAQRIYDWILTLEEEPLADEEKVGLLRAFVLALNDKATPLDEVLQMIEEEQATAVYGLHRKVLEVSMRRLKSGHFADAVEAAFKDIEKRVKVVHKEGTGEELTGKGLMFAAFSGEEPSIKLADLSDRIGRDIQEGYMHIFAGAMQGVRNPKAHDDIVLDPKRAVFQLYLASLLMDKLDEAGIPYPTPATRKGQ
jgi:uncharacterized protein (TIGR02391 family)